MKEFWNDARWFKGKKIPLVSGRGAIVISDITDDALSVTLDSTGKERRIERYKFERAFQKGDGAPIRPLQVRDWGISKVHTSYVAALVNAVSQRRKRRK